MASYSTTFANGDSVMLTSNTAIWGVVVAQKIEGPASAPSVECLVAIRDADTANTNRTTDFRPFHQSLLSAKS